MAKLMLTLLAWAIHHVHAIACDQIASQSTDACCPVNWSDSASVHIEATVGDQATHRIIFSYSEVDFNTHIEPSLNNWFDMTTPGLLAKEIWHRAAPSQPQDLEKRVWMMLHERFTTVDAMSTHSEKILVKVQDHAQYHKDITIEYTGPNAQATMQSFVTKVEEAHEDHDTCSRDPSGACVYVLYWNSSAVEGSYNGI